MRAPTPDAHTHKPSPVPSSKPIPHHRAYYTDPIKRGQKQGASGDVLARCKTAESLLTTLLNKVVLTVSQRFCGVGMGVGALFLSH